MAESLVATSGRRIYADVTWHPSLSSSSNIPPIPRPASDVDETPSLSVFGEPIPPSQVEAMAKANGIPKPDGNADPESIKSYESATWEYLRQVIDKLVESADSTNLKSIVAQLFAENIVRGRFFFATACMRCQSKNPHLTPFYAALSGLVTTYFPPVGDILYRRLSFNFSEMLTHHKYNEELMNVTVKFLSRLINLGIVSFMAAVKLIHRCLEEETDTRVKLAVTLFEELRLPCHGPLLTDVRSQFIRIKESEKLKEEIRNMVALVLAEENWNKVFSEDPILPAELHWVISVLNPRSRLSEVKKPATNKDIFLDVYKPDKDFLKHERAYNLFRSIILRENYWAFMSPTSSKEQKYFSYCDDVARKSGVDQQSVFHQLLQNIKREDKVQFCLAIFKYSCLKNEPLSVVPLIEFLCKKDKRYTEALETCCFVMWLMVAGSTQLIIPTIRSFARLLHRGLLSWDFVAHLPFEPRDLTQINYCFLEEFFKLYKCGYDWHSISENLFRHCPCVPAAITFFRIIYLDEVADDLEKLWKEKNCIKTTKPTQFNKRKDVEIDSPNEETELREEVAQAEHKQQNDHSAQAQQIQHDGKWRRQRKMPKYLNDFVLPKHYI